MDQVTAQIILGAALAYILEALKKASWFPFLSNSSSKVWKTVASAIVAAGAALSIDFSWNAAAGVLTISGLTFAHAWNAAVVFGVSWLSQHGTYELLIHKSSGATDTPAAGLLDTAKKVAPIMALMILLPFTTTGCAPKTVQFETPAAQNYWNANEVVKTVGQVEDAVMDLEAKGAMPRNDARAAIHVCRILDIAIPASDKGWKSVALIAAWNAALVELPELGPAPDTWQQGVKAAWAAAKVRVTVFTTNTALSVLAGGIDGALSKL